MWLEVHIRIQNAVVLINFQCPASSQTVDVIKWIDFINSRRSTPSWAADDALKYFIKIPMFNSQLDRRWYNQIPRFQLQAELTMFFYTMVRQPANPPFLTALHMNWSKLNIISSYSDHVLCFDNFLMESN